MKLILESQPGVIVVEKEIDLSTLDELGQGVIHYQGNNYVYQDGNFDVIVYTKVTTFEFTALV